MIRIRQEMERDEEPATELGLGDDVLEFCDAVAKNYATVYDQPFPRDLVHDVAQFIEKNLKVDWPEPHPDDVRSAIRVAVSRAPRKKEVKAEDFERFVERFMAQADALWKDSPRAA